MKSSGSSGVDWTDEGAQEIPQDHIKILNPKMTASEINQSIKGGSTSEPIAVIFTPGIYELDETLLVENNGTVILGIGVPVLSGTKPHISIMQTKANGVKIGGIIFEAGSNDKLNSDDPSLLEIGQKGSNFGDSNSPSVLYDVYCRIGGRVVAQTNSYITIYDDYTMGDNFWLWRADHGTGAGSWDSAQSNNGLLVYGNNVTIYGLAVEHFQSNQVIWYGENGEVYFYQSELPYDVPEGYKVAASFKVDDKVKTFKGYGFGIYDYFRNGKNAYAESAIESPNNSGISFTNMVTKVLNYEVDNAHIKSVIKLTSKAGDKPTIGGTNASEDHRTWDAKHNKLIYDPYQYGFWKGTAN